MPQTRKTKTKKKRKASGSTIAEKWMEIAQSRGMTAQPPAARKAGAALWKLLGDRLPSVRLAAGFALASVRDPALVQAFILDLEGASSARAARAALILGEAGFQNAAPYFLATVTRQDRKASAAFARALGMLAEKSAAPVLIDALDDDFVPTEAAIALGQLNEPQAVPALIRALSHKNESVRAAAAYSLACLPAPSKEQERALRQRLTELSSDRSRRVRICAAVGRYEHADPEGLAAIRAALH